MPLNTITITEPVKDVSHDISHVVIDLEARTVIAGPITMVASDALMDELKNCLDVELPKDAKYKSHNIKLNE